MLRAMFLLNINVELRVKRAVAGIDRSLKFGMEQNLNKFQRPVNVVHPEARQHCKFSIAKEKTMKSKWIGGIIASV